MLLGNKIKSLRDEQKVLQRQLAAYLEIVQKLTKQVLVQAWKNMPQKVDIIHSIIILSINKL